MDAFAERAQVTEKMPLRVKSSRVPQFLSYWLFKVESTILKSIDDMFSKNIVHNITHSQNRKLCPTHIHALLQNQKEKTRNLRFARK
jgi:hypothetical protein